MKYFRSLCFLILLFGVGMVGSAAEKRLGWQVKSRTSDGLVEYDPATGTITALQGVTITYSNVVLTADKVLASEESGEVAAEGSVTIKRESQVWTGEKLSYNFKTGAMKTDAFRTGQNPFFVAGEKLAGDKTNNIYTATNTVVTTDDYANPAYKIRAREMTLVSGDYFEAHDATVYLGKVPVFYFPYLKRSLVRPPNNFRFTPGYQSEDGAYLLSAYNWYWNERLSGALNLDLRQKRGVGYGPDVNYDMGKFGQGKFSYYHLDDDKPGLDPLSNPIDSDRERIKFSHQATIRTNLTFKTLVNYQTDAYVARDFFESEYRHDVQPKTFAEVNQLWPNFSLDILAQPQVNDFYETVERLPDVKLSALRQQLGVTPFYYEGENSVGYFHRRFADNITPDFSAFRGDSYHQITLPQTYFGWLNVTPRVGGRFTYYSEADGPGAATTDQTRGVFNTGAEVSVKSSRVWGGTQNKFLDVSGIRHIIQPSVNYVFVPSPNVLPPQLPQFDYELQSFRLLPIDFPDYNAIDSIDSQNVLRFTLLNKLQTKREQQIDNLLNWALYTDWRLKPRTGQGTFADVYSDMDFKPRSWMTFNSETRYDIADSQWNEANHRLTIQPNNVWSATLGHRYLAEEFGPDSDHNLIYDSFYYRINENWGTRMSHYFEARDGTMEEQMYTIYRDLRSWTAALTFRVRGNRTGSDDYGIAITFSLKAFPRFKMGQDTDKPWMLLGS